jgi:radical SAM protein with 4Fe4S-binding SPASM domain
MFKRIYLEISNICNVQCSFCPVVDRDKRKMTPSEIEKILSNINPLTEEVCLHLMGEPTAHPELERILKVADDLGVRINLTTNGLLIQRKQDLILNSKCIRQINFSLQAYQDNFPHKPFSGYFNPILEFTSKVFELREDMYINYRLWNVGDEGVDNEEIYQEIEKYFKIEVNRNIQVEHRKSKRLLNKLYLHFDSRFIWPELSTPILSEVGRCHGLGSHIGIHADGTVVPCCLDKEAVINLGNIKEQPLEEILASPLALSIKNGFDNNKLVHDLCKRCDYIQRFNKKNKNVSN